MTEYEKKQRAEIVQYFQSMTEEEFKRRADNAIRYCEENNLLNIMENNIKSLDELAKITQG